MTRLIETDPSEQTFEWLRRSIRENERLLTTLGGSADTALDDLRRAVSAEIDRRRLELSVAR